MISLFDKNHFNHKLALKIEEAGFLTWANCILQKNNNWDHFHSHGGAEIICGFDTGTLRHYLPISSKCFLSIISTPTLNIWSNAMLENFCSKIGILENGHFL